MQRDRGTSIPSDRVLVRRMMAGDETAVDTFVDHHLRALYRFTSHQLHDDFHIVGDIVQSTLSKAFANLPSFRGESALITWLCAICRREIAMHYRRLKSRPRELVVESTSLDQNPPARNPSPAQAEATLLSKETARFVHMTLDLLPAHYANALEWKYLDELPVQEIASRLGIGRKAAESLLTRARSAFRTCHNRLVEDHCSPFADEQDSIQGRKASTS